MKPYKYLLICLLELLPLLTFAQNQQLKSGVSLTAHPRILCLKGQEAAIITNIKTDSLWAKVHRSILTDCDAMIDMPPVEHVLIGRRLLDKARECLRRVFYLSYAYRTTHQEKYLKRAEKEMLAVAAFSDWNPSHFLDVSETTMALSIGYDWLYIDLPESSCATIREAILKKGIEPSLKPEYNSWLTANHNWNQVCNAGIAYGAMVTYEDHPPLSLQVINRAIESIKLPMQQYEPDGVYQEGYAYWEYGTAFNAMFISALETAFKSDFGLIKSSPGFMKTASFLENMTGPSGKPFNFSDCSPNAAFNAGIFWFAGKLNDPSLLWVEQQQAMVKGALNNRLLPAVMIWGKNIRSADIKAPVTTLWVGHGANPVALMRNPWTYPNGIFVGLKGGSASINHAHMDVGSFVMESNGVRWAIDLGSQDYESLESKKVDLWNMKQNSQRWQVLRYNNFNHNTLTLNDGLQNVAGGAFIEYTSKDPDFISAVTYLTPVYDGKAADVKRGVAIVDKSYVVVRDELETNTDSLTVRWSMVTPADVKIIDKNTAELTKDGKKLTMTIQGVANMKIKIWSTTPKADYDAPNPDTQIVGFEVKLPPNTKQALTVLLIPQSQPAAVTAAVKPLAKWPGKN